MTTNTRKSLFTLFVAMSLAVTFTAEAEKDTFLNVPSFELPMSRFISREAANKINGELKSGKLACDWNKVDGKDMDLVEETRKCQDRLNKEMLTKVRKDYDVDIEQMTLGGVNTYVVTPADGISDRNKYRVLVSLPGSSFFINTNLRAQTYAIPVAAAGKIKVVGVDYRKGPEYKHPAAIEDVAAVYRELLKNYRPESIGFYGCSAGGQLAAQIPAWFQKVGLPLPGALDSSGGALAGFDTDSMYIASAIFNQPTTVKKNREWPKKGWHYVEGEDYQNPLMYPALLSEEILKTFPPILLSAGGRDGNLSSNTIMHTRLLKLGVDASLVVWDGLGHCDNVNPLLPEGREYRDIMLRFFDKHLKP